MPPSFKPVLIGSETKRRAQIWRASTREGRRALLRELGRFKSARTDFLRDLMQIAARRLSENGRDASESELFPQLLTRRASRRESCWKTKVLAAATTTTTQIKLSSRVARAAESAQRRLAQVSAAHLRRRRSESRRRPAGVSGASRQSSSSLTRTSPLSAYSSSSGGRLELAMYEARRARTPRSSSTSKSEGNSPSGGSR